MTKEQRAPWTPLGEEKGKAIQSMFDRIAPSYDRVNGLMSLGRHTRWRAIAVRVLQLSPGDAALDVCCGTGDFMIPLRDAVGPNGAVVGLDFSFPMLGEAARKRTPGLLVRGDACRLPIRSESVDGLTVGWGLRNVTDLDMALREFHRVLRPGGRMVTLDMALPTAAPIRAVSRWVGGRLLPWLGAQFGHRDAYTYLPASVETFASRAEMMAAMSRAGFVDVKNKDLMMGNIAMQWGRKP